MNVSCAIQDEQITGMGPVQSVGRGQQTRRAPASSQSWDLLFPSVEWVSGLHTPPPKNTVGIFISLLLSWCKSQSQKQGQLLILWEPGLGLRMRLVQVRHHISDPVELCLMSLQALPSVAPPHL